MRLSISVALPLLLPLRVVLTRVPMSPTNQRAGITAAAIAYFLWGLFPLYWSLLAAVPNSQLLAHRVAWCAVAVWLYLLLRGEGGWWRSLPLKVAGWLTLSALLNSWASTPAMSSIPAWAISLRPWSTCCLACWCYVSACRCCNGWL